MTISLIPISLDTALSCKKSAKMTQTVESKNKNKNCEEP